MKLAVIILGALVATTLAEHNGFPDIPNMPNINILNNFKDGKMPEIPPGMKISDLKDAFYNLPPSLKEKLNEMAQSFGMQLDDVEDALNNPPEKLQKFFDKNGDGPAPPQGGNPMGNMGDLLKNIDMGSVAGMLKGVDVGSLMKNIDPDTISGLMQNMDMGAMGDIMKNMDMGAMTGMMKNMDMGAMADIMKNVDVAGIMKNMDMGSMGDMMKNVDVGGIMNSMGQGNIGDMMKNVDVGGIMKNMDMGAMGDIMKNVDVGGIMKNMDMGAMGNIMKNMDMGSISGIMKNMDMGAMTDMMKNVDVAGIMKNMDMGAMGDMMKNMDMGAISGIMKNMDLGAMGNMMKNMDMGAITGMMKNVDVSSIMGMAKNMDIAGMMKGKLPSLEGIKAVFGIPEEASVEDIRDMIRDKLDEAGIPMNSPVKLLEYVKEKVKMLPLPADMDPSDMLNMIHGQLEAMGIPEDPTKLPEYVLEKVGLEDIKNFEDLKDPEVIAKILQKKAFKAMGIDENEDPNKVTERIKKQLLEEAEKLGSELPEDYTQAEVMTAMDKVLTKELNEFLGTDAKSIVPKELHHAVQSKLQSMGFPVDNFGSLKKHIIDMAMKHLMKKAIPMVMNFIMPKSRPQMPPQMPPQMMQQQMMQQQMMQQQMMEQQRMQSQMPHMMPPVMPLNLEIEVNVDQPSMPPMMQMPRYLNGAEQAVHHPDLDRYDDASVYHHIMAVREALRYGEMPEDALQELVEDLMNARLKARVLSVRNMFLNDRIAAMERDVEMMNEEAVQAVPMRSRPAPASPLSRILRPRVL